MYPPSRAYPLPRVYVPSRELFTLLYIRPSAHLPRPVFIPSRVPFAPLRVYTLACPFPQFVPPPPRVRLIDFPKYDLLFSNSSVFSLYSDSVGDPILTISPGSEIQSSARYSLGVTSC